MIAAVRIFLAILFLLLAAAPASAGEDVGLLRALGTDTRPSWPGYMASSPNGTALFSADDGIHGRELWRTDGTAAGTTLLADLLPGPAGSAPEALEVIDGIVYFVAYDAGERWEIWRSDGSAAGTRRLVTSQPASDARGAAAAAPRPVFQPLGDELRLLVPTRRRTGARDHRRARSGRHAHARRAAGCRHDPPRAVGLDRRHDLLRAQLRPLPLRRHARGHAADPARRRDRAHGRGRRPRRLLRLSRRQQLPRPGRRPRRDARGRSATARGSCTRSEAGCTSATATGSTRGRRARR